MPVVRFILWAMFRLLVSLRYRVRVHGLEHLRNFKEGTLILPNHPAYMDPPLVFLSLWRALKPRPLAFEGNFQNPVFYLLMKLIVLCPCPIWSGPAPKPGPGASGPSRK